MFKNKQPKPPEKREVLRRSSVGMWNHLDGELETALSRAALLSDADEVIACLNDSPRFKRNLQDEAERRIAAKQKELEAAIEAFKNAARTGDA